MAARESHHVGRGDPRLSVCTSPLVPSVSNFSIQYNYACASIAIAIMLSHNDDVVTMEEADFPEPGWAQNSLLALVFVGSVLGMLLMGYLGDLLGIHQSLVLTNTLVVFGALSCGALAWGRPAWVWRVIALGRFVLGFGIGGNYPLSAAAAAQEASPSSVEDVLQKTGGAFFWQSPGACTPYLVGLVLLRLPHRKGITSFQFRSLFLLGAAPAMYIWYNSLRRARQAGHFGSSAAGAGAGGDGPKKRLRDALREGHNFRSLVGTAGTWFLFDVAFYGTSIFTPAILEDVFGDSQTINAMLSHGLFIAVLGVFGTRMGLAVLPKIGAKVLNTAGLAVSGACFLACALLFDARPAGGLAIFGALSITFFALTMGPNIATFVLPVVCFPTETRSRFHGLSSAGAKLGAMSGAILFPPFSSSHGVRGVMLMQAMICSVAAILSHCCLPDLDQSTDSPAVAGPDEENVEQGIELPVPTTIGVLEADEEQLQASGEGPAGDVDEDYPQSKKAQKKLEKDKLLA